MEEYITLIRGDETVTPGPPPCRRACPRQPDCLYRRAGRWQSKFCQGIAEGLGCTDLFQPGNLCRVNYYRGPRPFAHFDLYRIHTEVDLSAAGFYDYLDMGAVVAAEWSENCADLLALENPIYINIDRLDETTRKITITRPGA